MPSTINNRPTIVDITPPKLPPQFWEELYQKHRNNFIYNAIRNYNCSRTEAKDIFQDIAITLYHRHLANKPIPTGNGLNAYLYVAGNNLLKTRFRRLTIHKKAIAHLAHQQVLTSTGAFHSDHLEKWSEVQKEIAKLGYGAEKLIELIFFKDYCPEAVARELGYKNTNVVKVRKNVILNTLKHIFKKK